MFDVSFTELLLIGVVALVVIGPERLPKVARTVGHLLGRAQRYVSDVKSDIQREIDLDEVNKLKKQMDDAAQSLQASMRETSDSLREPLKEARESLVEASASVESLVEQARQEIGGTPKAGSPPAQAAPEADAEPPKLDAGQPPPASQGDAEPPGGDRRTAEQSGTPT